MMMMFARISYGWFVATPYKFKLSTFVKETLVISRRSCLQREI